MLLEMTPAQADILSYAQLSGMISFELMEKEVADCQAGLAEMLQSSTSAESFQSILVTYMVQSIFPGVNVNVIATPRGFIVKGKVPDPQIAEKIMEIFAKLVPRGDKTIINMMEIKPQQVLLCVKFFEVGKHLVSRVGINWKVLLQTGSQLLAFGATYPTIMVPEIWTMV